jgi:ubiquinone/menaquinone biosynthesis C-methylase UbiE
MSGRKLDIVFDLNNCAENKIPLPDNSIDGVYASHVLEHIDNTLHLMQELHRVAKNNAKFFLRIPYGATDDAWEDPTHKRAYFENSFLYFSQPAYSKADYGYLGDWQCEKITLIVPENFIATQRDNAYTIIKSQRNIVSEMIVELRAIKPVRPRLLGLLKNGVVELSTDSRVYPDFN